MDTQLLTVIISGGISLVGAFGSILLKDHLDRRRTYASPGPEQRDAEPSAPSGSPRIFGSILVVAFAVGVGYLSQSRGYQDSFDPKLLFWVAVAAVPVLLWRNMRSGARSALAYQFAILTLWAGMLAGSSLNRGHIWEDQVYTFFFCWLASAVLGLVMFAATRKRRAPA